MKKICVKKWGEVCSRLSLKILRIMRLTLFLLLTSLTQVIAVNSYSQVTKISLDMKSSTVKDVLYEIESKSEFYFLFNSKLVDVDRKVDIKVTNERLDQVLEKLFDGYGVSYSVMDRQIIIQPSGMASKTETQQQKMVSGKVTDTRNQPLPGVTVVVKGTTQGTVTNADGEYALSNIPADATLQFSFVGMKTQEIVVGNQANINVMMEEEAIGIEEVVAVGYSLVKKRDISGAVTSVSAQDLEIISTTSIQNKLQSMIPGVTIRNSGEPGVASQVRIRGVGTISNNEPLYVVDGVPSQSGFVNQLIPEDIESVQVLKDAASASIYGSRASNGVIVITTKKGKSGKTSLDINLYNGVQMPTNLPEVLNSNQYVNVLWQAMKNSGIKPTHPQFGSGELPIIPDFIVPTGAFEGEVDLTTYNTGSNQYMRANKEGTDWLNKIYNPALIQNYHLSSSGGNNFSNYALSAGYTKQDGIAKYTGFERFSFRTNSLFSITNNINIGENLNAISTLSKGIGSGNALWRGIMMPPIIPIYDINGNFAGSKAKGFDTYENPYATLYNNRDNTEESLLLFGNLFAEINFLESFRFKSNIGVDIGRGFRKSFSVIEYWNQSPSSTNGLSNYYEKNFEWVFSNTLTYKKIVADSHDINLLLGTESIRHENEYTNASRNSFLSDDLSYRYLSAGESNQLNSGAGYNWGLLSFFGRLDYKFKDKYLLTFTMRRDGSSRFGLDNRYGNFPAFSAGWRISEESFFKDIEVISELKIRGSWGKTGNQEIGYYPYASIYGTNSNANDYPIDGSNNNVTSGLNKQSIGNNTIKWETTTQSNLGFDAAFLENRFNLTFDLYRKLTTGILQQVQYPGTAGGAASPYENIGEVLNEGLEFGLNYRNVVDKDFNYEIGFNISSYRNEVIKLAGGDFIQNGPNRTEEGHPIGSYYGYIIDGIFQDEEEVQKHATQNLKAVGRWKYRDVKVDGVINDQDRTFIGNPHPDFEYGLNAKVSYKDFDLSVFLQGTYGNDLYLNKSGQDFWTYNGNRSTRILDSWTPDNRDAELPELSMNNPNNESGNPSTYFVEDGSYLRIRNLQLGFNINRMGLLKIDIERIRLYFQADNLLTITKYNGIDPEVLNSDLRIGYDDLPAYPISRTFTFGINIFL